MPIIPALEIGLWNAWIFMILILLPLPLVALVRRGVFQTTASIRASVLSRTEQKIAIFSDVMFLVLVIYSIFLPLQLGTIWFAIGLPVYLLGLILQTIAYVNVATSPVDEPVTKGVYRYSRHPMYVALPATLIGTGLASVSWPFLLVSVIVVVSHLYSGVLEERECLEAYGSAYREYMNGTPRWIGIPKSEKN